uniref:Uncharacterized protein n=1 Tax=Caenorhabditis tropicalis TaxID=1561998 RepID=A0A1I7TVS8_9PELO
MSSNSSIIVYSAPCPIGAFSPTEGAPPGTLLLEVSKTTLVPVPISLEDLERAKELIHNSIDTLESVVNVGKSLLEDEGLHSALEMFVGVGDVFKGILKFIPKPENPLIKSIEQLEGKVKKLEQKMDDHFNEMKSFISEVKFYMKIIRPTKTLIRHMKDCIKHPGPEATKNFKKAYLEHTPLSLAYLMISYLEHKSTNPLRLAMNAEKIKTKATFNKWEDMITRLILQAFANGLLGLRKKLNLDLLIEGSNEVLKVIKEWKGEYEQNQDDSYWQQVRGVLEAYIVSHTNLDNDRKTRELKEIMENYFITDAFFIAIFNEGDPWDIMRMHCPNKDSQLIECYGKGLCNAFIYRSRHANKKTVDDYTVVKHVMENQSSPFHRDYYINNIKSQMEQRVPGDFFHCYIKALTTGIQYQSANLRVPDQRSPGFISVCTVQNGLDVSSYFLMGFFP